MSPPNVFEYRSVALQYTCMFISAGEPGNAKKIQASVAAARKVFRILGVCIQAFVTICCLEVSLLCTCERGSILAHHVVSSIAW